MRARPRRCLHHACSSSWVTETACYTPGLVVKVLEERCSYVIACRIIIPSVLLHHTVCDVPAEVGKEKAPSFSFINLRVLCVLPHTKVQRNMKVAVRKPNSDHLCGTVIALSLGWDGEFAFHDPGADEPLINRERCPVKPVLRHKHGIDLGPEHPQEFMTLPYVAHHSRSSHLHCG